MSFDLGVWYSRRPLSNGEAAEIYGALAEGTDLPTDAAVEPSPVVAAFLTALDARYPNLDALPEDQVDESPWASGFESSERHVLLNLRWGASDDVVLWIVRLAAEHGLVLFDPQGDEVHLPPTMPKRRSGWRFWR